MRHLTALDQNNDPCLMVIKRGNTTGLTVGRANDICSYARNYCGGDKAETSKEWAILPSDSKAFSDKGDSGSVIVDGLLTGGAGATPSLDVTYTRPSASSSSACTTNDSASPTSTWSSLPRCIHQIDSQPNSAIYPRNAGEAVRSEGFSFLFTLLLRLLLSPLLLPSPFLFCNFFFYSPLSFIYGGTGGSVLQSHLLLNGR
ncbi:hypothetical protein V8E52_002503 [Russula decolorans]